VQQEPIRLNKFIAQRLNVGRRAADDLISAGKVRINGAVPVLGARVNHGDEVTADGTRLSFTDAPHFLYVLLDKPTGYVCSRRQQGDTPTIFSLLPAEYQHLKPVGRLDKDSSGLLLLTNDGDIAHQLMHPSFVKVKIYEVALDKPLVPLHKQMINDHGLQLPDGPSKLQLQKLHDGDDTQWQVTMHEGRNRQIRRTFAALGYNVTALRRTQFGRFSLHQLGKKQLMPLPTSEISQI
jgi:23S rRNA pseudouridine2605 synthase